MPHVFDVCHVGVVLRVVLGVQTLVLLLSLHGVYSASQWLMRAGLLTAEALPAALCWLVLACPLSRVLQRLAPAAQGGAAAALGVAAAAFSHAQVAWALAPQEAGLALSQPWAWAGPLVSGAAFGLLVWVWLRSRQARVLPAQTQARLVELQARIRPHFLFNTLNTAIALVQVDPDRAEVVLEDLAELFRRALASPATRSTLADEVELAQRYLAIETLRFGERLSVNWQVDPTTEAALVPTLLLQPLVENAVRHGVEADPQGSWIRVQTQRLGERVVVTVTNGLPAEAVAQGRARKGHGMALRNVRQRLLLMHDVEAEFEAGPVPMAPGSAQQCYRVRFAWPDATVRSNPSNAHPSGPHASQEGP
jgi:two-component system sensor histidine kinase AlgZ